MRRQPATFEKLKERFWNFVDKHSSDVFYKGARCWEFVGYTEPARNESCINGYGHIERWFDGVKETLAHRIAYRYTYSAIPEGMHVLHNCDNRSCVRPSHLFLGTEQDNSDDKISKGRDNHAQGERTNHAKVTAEIVRQIRLDYQNKKGFHRQLAVKYGLSESAIGHILRRYTWKHIY